MAPDDQSALKWVETPNPRYPGIRFFQPQEDPELMQKLAKPPELASQCDKACTALVTLFPKGDVLPGTGRGYVMINIDGYRMMNVYLIGQALSSTSQRGFSLDLSFSPYDFVLGVGVVGESQYFFDYDTYFNPVFPRQRTLPIGITDTTIAGGAGQYGGVDLTYIVRIPVLGPFVRASVFNEDPTRTQSAQVVAYLST